MIHVTKSSDLPIQEIINRVSRSLREAFPSESGPYLEALYDDRVVFERDRKLWQVGFSFDPATLQVSFSGAPVEVVCTYQPVGAVAMAQAAAAPAPETKAEEPAANLAAATEKAQAVVKALRGSVQLDGDAVKKAAAAVNNPGTDAATAPAGFEWPADMAADLAAKKRAKAQPGAA